MSAESAYLSGVPTLADLLAPYGGIGRASPADRKAELDRLKRLIRARREAWERENNWLIEPETPVGVFELRRVRE